MEGSDSNQVGIEEQSYMGDSVKTRSHFFIVDVVPIEIDGILTA